MGSGDPAKARQGLDMSEVSTCLAGEICVWLVTSFGPWRPAEG